MAKKKLGDDELKKYFFDSKHRNKILKKKFIQNKVSWLVGVGIALVHCIHCIYL